MRRGQKEQAAAIADYVLTAYESQTVEEGQMHEFKCELVIDIILSNIEEEMNEEVRAAIVSISKSILDLYEEKMILGKEDCRQSRACSLKVSLSESAQ